MTMMNDPGAENICKPNLYGYGHCFHVTATAMYRKPADFCEILKTCCWCGVERREKHGTHLEFKNRWINVEVRKTK